MYCRCPLTGCYRGLALVSTVTCTISHYPYRDGKRKVILTVRFDRLRPVGVLVRRPEGVLVPRPVVVLVPRLVSLLVSRLIGVLGLRPVCPLVPRLIGVLASRLVGFLVLRLIGVLASRPVCPLVPRLFGVLVSRPVRLLVSRLVGVLVSWVDGESGGGQSECDDETMPVGSSCGLSVSSSDGGPVRWCPSLPCPDNRSPAILRFVEGR